MKFQRLSKEVIVIIVKMWRVIKKNCLKIKNNNYLYEILGKLEELL